MTSLERLQEVVSQKRETMDRLADVLRKSDRLVWTVDSRAAYMKVWGAWMFAKQFLEIKQEAEAGNKATYHPRDRRRLAAAVEWWRGRKDRGLCFPNLVIG